MLGTFATGLLRSTIPRRRSGFGKHNTVGFVYGVPTGCGLFILLLYFLQIFKQSALG